MANSQWHGQTRLIGALKQSEGGQPDERFWEAVEEMANSDGVRPGGGKVLAVLPQSRAAKLGVRKMRPGTQRKA
eukprot:4656014-Alexandrium_andersonii.AAC.1